MKISKKILVLMMAAVLCFGMTACGGGGDDNGGSVDDQNKTSGSDADQDSKTAADTKTYANAGDTYTIDVPGTWTDNTASSSNSDAIILDNEDQTLTIMVQRYPKEAMDQSLTTKDLSGFTELYHTTAIKSLIDMSEEPTTEDLTLDGMTAAKAEEYTSTQGDVTVKTYIALIESPNAYYSYTITGLEDLYDGSITDLKDSVKTLTEKAE